MLYLGYTALHFFGKLIFEIANSYFKDGQESSYAMIWSDQSMGRIENCRVDKAARPFLALSNKSLLEMRHTDIAAVKAPAVVQENSQLFVQGHVQSATWQKDTASKVSQINLLSSILTGKTSIKCSHVYWLYKGSTYRYGIINRQ